MLRTGTTYYPIISVIAFVGAGGLSYHLLTTMCNADTFSGLCGFVAGGLSAVLLVSLIFSKKSKVSFESRATEIQESKSEESICESSPTIQPEANKITPDKSVAIESCREYVSMIAEKYFPATQRTKLMEIFESYCSRTISPVKITSGKDTLGLTPIDLMHFMVNIWRKMKWIDRRFTARFLKDEPMIGVEEAARILNLAVSTVYKLTQQKRIPYYQPAKQLLFKKSELQDTSKNVPQKMKDRFAQLGIKDPNTKKRRRKYRTVVTVIIGGSTERINKLAFGDQEINFSKGADNSNVTRCQEIEDWAKDMYAFACEQWGEDNIVGFYVHLDETWVHIHCSVVPITVDGRLNFNDWYTDSGKYDFRERMTQWHNRLAEYNQKWGLARGRSVKVTGAKHISAEEYRRNLAQRCAEYEARIANREVTLQEMMKEYDRVKRAVYGQTAMLKNLEEKKSVLLQEIAELKQTKENESNNAAALEKLIAEKEKSLAEIDATIIDRQERCSLSQQELDFIKAQIAQMKLNYDGVMTLVRDTAQSRRVQISHAVAAAGFEELVQAFSNVFLNVMSDKEAEHFEGTLIKDMAERGNQIFACACLLFVGLVDEATEIAYSSGGGESTSELPWGRKEDESDKEYARRCLHQAQQMVRGANKRRPKNKR